MSDEVTLKRLGAVDEGEQAAVVALLRRQKTVPEIAELLGRSPDRVLSMVATAKAYMEASALHVAAKWMEAIEISTAKGSHYAARDFMTAIGAVAPPPGAQAKATASAQVVVVSGFALPGLPAPKDVTPQT